MTYKLCFFDRGAQEKLEDETGSVFGNVAWLDTITRLNQVTLRVRQRSTP